jgi:putative transposase
MCLHQQGPQSAAVQLYHVPPPKRTSEQNSLVIVPSVTPSSWQGRYYSCPLDRPHLWEALCYTERNPMRANLVTEARWAWSSAAAHCGVTQADTFLSMELWHTHWTSTSWRKYLAAGETETELASIRQCTHTGRPLGTQEFVLALENAMERRLAPQKGGRPAKPRPDARQADFHFIP